MNVLSKENFRIKHFMAWFFCLDPKNSKQLARPEGRGGFVRLGWGEWCQLGECMLAPGGQRLGTWVFWEREGHAPCRHNLHSSFFSPGKAGWLPEMGNARRPPFTSSAAHCPFPSLQALQIGSQIIWLSSIWAATFRSMWIVPSLSPMVDSGVNRGTWRSNLDHCHLLLL